MKNKNIIYMSLFVALIAFGALIRNVYFAKENYARMLVTFGHNELPYIDLHIQENTFPVLVNLSACVPFTLSKDMLATLRKKPYKTIKFKDENSNIIECPTFLVSEIKMGGFTFKDIEIAERELYPDQKIGEIGLPFLRQNNLLLDFPNSTIIVSNDKKKLKKIGYNLEEMPPVSFQVIEKLGGILLPVITDLGVMHLILSTGTTLNMIQASSVKDRDSQDAKLRSTFVIGGKKCKDQDLYLVDLPSEVNGAIGMEFLHNHVIYINFKENKIHIAND